MFGWYNNGYADVSKYNLGILHQTFTVYFKCKGGIMTAFNYRENQDNKWIQKVSAWNNVKFFDVSRAEIKTQRQGEKERKMSTQKDT